MMTIESMSPVDVPEDAKDIPPMGMEDLTDPDNVCNVTGCAKPVKAYGGRGKRPRKCEEHSARPAARVSRGTSSRTDAARAAEVLAQMNALVAFGTIMAGLPATGSAMSTANEGFKDAATAALELDPNLCRTILRVGAKSGQAALVAAYAQLLIAVVPVMIYNLKQFREQEAF